MRLFDKFKNKNTKITFIENAVELSSQNQFIRELLN